MKTGMSKFTKGCLLTALVTFIIGCLICGVGALLGGFRLLDGMDIQGITGIPFHFHRYENGGIQYGFGWDDDWDNDWDDDWDNDWNDDVDWSAYEKWNSIKDSDDKIKLDLTADTLRDLDIELGACELHIMESSDEYVWLDISGNTKYFRYLVEDGDTLQMVHRTGRGFWNWSTGKINTTTKVYLYLPEGAMPNNAEIEIGAGSMESIGLQAHEMNLEVGAGLCEIGGLTSVDSLELMVGAGRINIESLTAGKMDMDVGAGELCINDAEVDGDADLELGVGSVELNGLFSGNMNVDCGMGNVTLYLQDAEEDHNYEIDCAMGNVNLGSRSYTGLADEKTIFNGSSSTYEIECSMGSVNINFAN
ncbi:MAG: DUF4097 domain-containing protein [Lachnospiraceae bacterium]|nr:DUF4097 domain-containing protein [Lachnospiraceae bacterium]